MPLLEEIQNKIFYNHVGYDHMEFEVGSEDKIEFKIITVEENLYSYTCSVQDKFREFVLENSSCGSDQANFLSRKNNALYQIGTIGEQDIIQWTSSFNFFADLYEEYRK